MFLLSKSNDRTPLPRHWVEALFKRMTARYGQLWVDRYGRVGLTKDELIEEWSAELAGFSGQEIARGLEASKVCKFPPTLPEFIAFCRPPIDAQAAHSETVKNLAFRSRGDDVQWSHPALYWAAVAVGQYDVMNTSYPAIKARWEAALETQMSKSKIDPVPPPMRALPAPKGSVSAETMTALRELVQKMKAQQ